MGLCESRNESSVTESETTTTADEEILANFQIDKSDYDYIPEGGFTTTEWLLLILVLLVAMKVFLSIFKLLQKEILEDDVEKIIKRAVCM